MIVIFVPIQVIDFLIVSDLAQKRFHNKAVDNPTMLTITTPETNPRVPMTISRALQKAAFVFSPLIIRGDDFPINTAHVAEVRDLVTHKIIY